MSSTNTLAREEAVEGWTMFVLWSINIIWSDKEESRKWSTKMLSFKNKYASEMIILQIIWETSTLVSLHTHHCREHWRFIFHFYFFQKSGESSDGRMTKCYRGPEWDPGSKIPTESSLFKEWRIEPQSPFPVLTVLLVHKLLCISKPMTLQHK